MRRNSALDQSFDDVKLEDNDDIFDRIEAKDSMIVGEDCKLFKSPFTDMNILDQNMEETAAAIQLDRNNIDKVMLLETALVLPQASTAAQDHLGFQQLPVVADYEQDHDINNIFRVAKYEDIFGTAERADEVSPLLRQTQSH